METRPKTTYNSKDHSLALLEQEQETTEDGCESIEPLERSPASDIQRTPITEKKAPKTSPRNKFRKKSPTLLKFHRGCPEEVKKVLNETMLDNIKRGRNIHDCRFSLKDAYRTFNRDQIQHIHSPQEVELENNVFSDGDKTPVNRQSKN